MLQSLGAAQSAVINGKDAAKPGFFKDKGSKFNAKEIIS